MAGWLADRTRITLAPSDVTVNRSTSIVLECRADTDERETSTLTVRWFSGGGGNDDDDGGARLELSRNRDPRLRVDHVAGTLRLDDAQVYDSGRYLCVASTDVDSDSAHAQIIVTGTVHDLVVVVIVIAWLEAPEWTLRVSTSDLHAEGSLVENTSAEVAPVARQVNAAGWPKTKRIA